MKPWKGYKQLTLPNNKKCHICNEINADWYLPENSVILHSKFPEVHVHYLCLYKSFHYDMNPIEYSKWQSEFSRIRKQVLERDKYVCVICNNQSEYCIKKLKIKGKIPIHVHHKITVRDGGTNELSNLITTCAYCNSQLDNKIRKEKKKELLS